MRLAPSFVRHLFVHCSFIVRLLFVFCSSFVRSLFVFCSFIVRYFIICSCGSHRLLFVNRLSARAARTVFCLLIVYLPVWLAPSFVFLKLALTLFYLQISLVFQTDSLYQFLFKACPPSGVRGLLTPLFSIWPCILHRFLYELCSSFKLWQSWNPLITFFLSIF